MLSLSNRLTNFDFNDSWTQIDKTGFFVFVISHTFTLKYYLDTIYLPLFKNYAEPTVATMSVKKFFIDLVSTPKSMTFELEPENKIKRYLILVYRIHQVNSDSFHKQKYYPILDAFLNMLLTINSLMSDDDLLLNLLCMVSGVSINSINMTALHLSTKYIVHYLMG